LKRSKNHIDLQIKKIRDRIRIRTDGWAANKRYEDALEENEPVKAEALDGEDEATRNEILENWPFDDHEY
jgi:hypothetical protein